jgi:hypothetical protein
MAWDSCDRAIRAGLPPPPRHFKRSPMVTYRPPSNAILPRASVDPIPEAYTASSTSSTGIDFVFAEASRHVWFTWLFWFCVALVQITQAKRGGRILWRMFRTKRYDNCQLLLNSVLTTSIITMSVVVVVSAQGRWVAANQQEANYQYCRNAPVSPSLPLMSSHPTKSS